LASLLQGITIGLFVPTMIILISGLTVKKTYGTAMSMFQISMHVGGAIIGAIIVMAVSELPVNYIYVIMGLMSFIALILMLFIKVPKESS